MKREQNQEVLLQAKEAWDNLSHFRTTRKRNRDYTYGKQWGDVVDVPGGGKMSEETLLRNQGRTPLKNNVIRKLVKNIVGQFRSSETEPVCIARDRNEQNIGEVMSITMQYAYQHNRMWEVDGRSMEEFLISGSTFHKIGYGWRRNKEDVWVDVVNPNRIFFNTMEDARHWDCTLIGELHDVPLADVLEKFAGTSAERSQEIREIYRHASDEFLRGSYNTLSSSEFDNLDFLMSRNNQYCRVIEVWRLEANERLRCHDQHTGEYYIEEQEVYDSILALNQERKQTHRPEIEVEWFIDRYWSYYFLSPFGDVLGSGETPYWHGEHPYTFKLYPLIDGEIHAFVEDVIDQQRYINRLITMIDYIMEASAKGVLLFPEDQLPDGMSITEVTDEWTRYNGVILFKPKPGGAIPQQISTNATNVGAYELLSLQMRLLEDISGVHSAVQGKAPVSGTSGALYRQETLNAGLNMLDMFSSFKSFREDRDMKVMKTIQQYYPEERYQHIVGREGNEMLPTYSPQQVRNTEFDLAITESMMSPSYRLSNNELLLDLFRMQQIDLRTLLETGSFAFSDKLLNKMKQQTTESQLPLDTSKVTP